VYQFYVDKWRSPGFDFTKIKNNLDRFDAFYGFVFLERADTVKASIRKIEKLKDMKVDLNLGFIGLPPFY